MFKFTTSDLHLGETRLQILGRPFSSTDEMMEVMIKNYNSMVGKNDEVLWVGDICYKETPEYLKYIEKFNGKKTLIRGNHDNSISDNEFSNYFDLIIADGGGLELDIEGIPCYATHYPTQGKKDRFNIVGHCHNAFKYQLNMLNVGVDVHHFFPVNLNTIPFYFKAICEYYDSDVWCAYNEINSQYFGIRGKKGSYFKNKG